MKKTNQRRDLKVDGEFHKRMKMLRDKLNATGKFEKDLSIQDVSKILLPEFEEIEKKLINGDIEFDIKVKMDKRRIFG